MSEWYEKRARDAKVASLLKRVWGQMPTNEILRLAQEIEPEVTLASVHRRVRELRRKGYITARYYSERNFDYWNAEDIARLEALLPTTSEKEIAAILGRSAHSVYQFLKRFRKNPDRRQELSADATTTPPSYEE